MANLSKSKKIAVSDIISPVSAPLNVPDELTLEELKHNRAMHKLHRASFVQDIEERKNYAKKLFRLISWWLLGMFVMVVSYGWTDSYFKPSEKVMLALIGSTTVNVLGLFAIVAKYFFPSIPPAVKKKKSK